MNSLQKRILEGATPVELWSEFADHYGWSGTEEMREALQGPLEAAWNELQIPGTFQVPLEDGTNPGTCLGRLAGTREDGSPRTWILVDDDSGFRLTDLKPKQAPMYQIPAWDGKKGKRTGAQVKRLSEHWRVPMRSKSEHDSPADYYRGPERQH